MSLAAVAEADTDEDGGCRRDVKGVFEAEATGQRVSVRDVEVGVELELEGTVVFLEVRARLAFGVARSFASLSISSVPRARD
jgi:hypothetical protein